MPGYISIWKLARRFLADDYKIYDPIEEKTKCSDV